MPIDATAAGTESTNVSGCTTWIGIPNRSRPQASVASSE